MNIAIIGASGSIGTAVTQTMLKQTDHALTLFSHQAEKIHYSPSDERRLNQVNGDILKQSDITDALKNIDVAIYLVHLMGAGKKESFISREITAANHFVHAALANNVRRVIYVGGMGTDANAKTNHLKSRQQTSAILHEHIPEMVEFKVPMVIGRRSAGFEVIRSLVHSTRVLPVPTWANATTQPIGISDVAAYVVAALSIRQLGSAVFCIGGPETLSYRTVLRRYAAYKKRKLYLIPIPFVPKRLVAMLFRVVKSSPFIVTVADMIDSAAHTTAFSDPAVKRIFPNISPKPIENDFF